MAGLGNINDIEPYNYNDEPSGRAETLTKALEKCERLEKQLKIAVEALEEYANEDHWEDCFAGFSSVSIDDGCYGVYGFSEAQEALIKIKELEK